ncbi:ribosomal protein S18-alanine N-acetyltransferase [Enterococcus dongliensis]|uniref:Ribosomal protein S18-alanine N-acetyltransferase n=1 Tax=Enterococcus dongliensis TaxID=2559925 RepID=A0AAP5KR57_9ENTE|nr:ribosomal protein S18-alanine N-acetyltransferase [Enterococcus dongliensis]MDT2597000.1 ribosomal protein S18-alanine N-acetyltransferase [Enterococcus dongliensis]MDT2603020.1 ribosomal protein S18-alanine N-acetyltransferase [Enterococcus dongliensis]MDT2633364.1 ribosomal protein S18-alanine N-acetyltransferase [Enterococcus dongliensis]MDT2636715.1 ribosomal protein S18-alanine N-acetyltransferase [Enterococcus dongliensis]MDT2638834.1 ribosomal protein S18-alanine N-acetyltransferase 
MLKKFSGLVKTILYGKQYPFDEKSIELHEEAYLLRKIVDQDIKELIALERDVYFGETPWTKSAFLAEIHSPIPHLYICIVSKQAQIAGFIGSRLIGNDTHITNIAVGTAFQNRGIGKLLIDEVENFAIMNDCETLSLEVRISNTDAQRLYRRLGFSARNIRKNYYTENNEDALDMIKHLEVR